MTKYKKIMFGATVAVVCVLFVFGLGHKTEQAPEPSGVVTYPANGTSGKTAREQEEIGAERKYYVALEGELLCAYLVENGETELLHSAKAAPLLMSDEDIKKLNRGIYAESYEDLWMYFESYSS